jgi:hypothetical protein
MIFASINFLLGCKHQSTDWVQVYRNEMETALANEDLESYRFYREELITEKLRIYRETGEVSKPIQ